MSNKEYALWFAIYAYFWGVLSGYLLKGLFG